MPRCLPPVVLLLVAASAADPKVPAWVEPMHKVHAKFTSTKGTFALFGDSITVSLAFCAGLPHSRRNMTPETEAAWKLVSAHIRKECWQNCHGPADGNEDRMTIRWAHENVDAWLKKFNSAAEGLKSSGFGLRNYLTFISYSEVIRHILAPRR
jgi:hypothetical protein